ncbi:MAG TPA: alpha/beta hydrolase [Anaerolineales bacterium]|nr:alpha/beta hydrolase [Anaerolineales bacterium]
MKLSASHPFRSARAKAEYQALYMERAKAWPVASETKLIETPSGQTFIRLSGRFTDPPLILLPGSRGTSLTWIPNIAALSAHYRTYALDSIYDFGLSVSRRNIKKPGDLVTWLDEVLTVLVPEGSLSLVGLSYGGWLASQYALRFPERLHKVVLLAPAATVLPVSFTLILRALLTLIPLPGFRQQFYYWLLQDTVRSGETGRAYVDEAVADWAAAERCFGPLPMVPATVLEDKVLQGSRVPCLFLVGENEKMYSARKAVKRLNRVAPRIKTELIPGAGHDLSIIQADLVTRTIVGFLGECEAGDSNAAKRME